jgi:O-antigen ligase
MDKTVTTDQGEGSTQQNGTGAIIILCAIVIVSILLYGAVDTGTLAILSILSILLLVYWTSTAWRSNKLSIELNIIQLPVIAIGVIGLIQLLPFRGSPIPDSAIDIPTTASLSLDPYSTRFFLMRLFFYLIFFAAALTFVNTISRLRLIVITLIAFGGLLAFYSILQRVEDPSSIYGLRQPSQAIPFGTFINRHHFAALMEMMLGLSLGLLFAGDIKRNRWPFLGAAAIVMAIAIILTGSRGGVIGLVTSIVAIAVFAVYGRSGKRERHRDGGYSPTIILTAGAVFLAVTIFIVLFLGGVDPLLRGTGIGAGAGDFTSGRLDFWRTAIRIFLEHPIIGAGLDAFGVAYSFYDPSSGMFRVEQAHNDYLQTLADAGIAGFICITAFIYLLLRKGARVIKNSGSGFRRGAAVGALAGCIGILVHSFFDFPLRTPANAFVFLALAAIAVVRLSDEKSHRHRRSSF